MAITAEGLTIKRYDEILSDLQTALRSYLGNNIDLTEDAILGIINIIYANSQTEQWEMAQAVYNAFNIESATDKQLDDLVTLVGLSRLSEAYSTGTLELTGREGASVPEGTAFETLVNQTPVLSTSDVIISASSCFQAIVNLAEAIEGAVYVISINGRAYSYTARAEDTVQEIFVRIASDINNDASATWSALYVLGENFFYINSEDKSFPMSINLGLYWNFSTVSVIVSGATTEVGVVPIQANTVQTIVDTTEGLTGVNNSAAFATGRLSETDDELRARHSVSTAIIGFNSIDSIESKMRQVEGVSYAEIFENNTLVTDSRGLPAKSFEIVVEGGSSSEVAKTLYSLKPVGIETFGNTPATVTDEDGDLQGVFYTRPTSIPVYVSVRYSLYNEEVFPANGESLIAQAVVSYANSLLLGEDVIAQRFFGSIFSNIAGISNLQIKVGLTENPTSSTVAVEVSERALITLDTVDVSLGTSAIFGVV